MEQWLLYTLYGSSIFLIFLIYIIIICFPLLAIATKIGWKKNKFGANSLLVIMYNRAGNFVIKGVANASKGEYIEKRDGKQFTYPFTREQIQQGKILGMSYILLPEEDAKTSIGLSYQSTDSEGNPEFLKNKEGNYILDPQGKKIPKIINIKPSVSLPPELIKAIIGAEALTKALKDLLSSTSNIFWLVVIIAGASAGAAYFSYQIKHEDIPQILSLCQQSYDIVKNFSEICISGGVKLP